MKLVLLLVSVCRLKVGSVVLAIFPWLKGSGLSPAKLYLRLIHGSVTDFSFLEIGTPCLFASLAGSKESNLEFERSGFGPWSR